MPTEKIGTAVETGIALPITATKTKTIGPAVETDTAMPITAVGGAAAAGTAVMAVGYQLMSAQPVPEPGYHLSHDHHDYVTGGLLLICGGLLTYAAVKERFTFDKRPV